MKTKSITTLPASPTQDRQYRFKRYVFTMSVRVVCFVGAVLIHNVWSIVPLILAGVIPWVAVVVANAGNRRGGDLVVPGGQLVKAGPEAVADREQQEQEREQQYRDEQRRRAEQAHAEQEAAERERAARAGARRAARTGHR
jgi:signal transduction histidine kinase